MCCYYTLPRSPVSPRNEIVYMFDTPIFVAAAQETPFDHLTLVASRAYVYKSYRVITNRRVLNQLHPMTQ